MPDMILILYFYYYRQNHGSALGFGVEELANSVSKIIADIKPVESLALAARSGFCDYLFNFFSRLRKKLWRLFHVNETARDNVGIAFYFAGLAVNNRNYNKHSVFGHNLPVAQNDFRNVANAKTVNHNVVGGDFF